MIVEEKTISSERIYTGKLISLKVDTVEIENKGYQKREIVEHQGAVAIVAITDEDKVVLIKQFRKPIEQVIWEIPAGKLEMGESPKDCAIRELKEETGLDLISINKINSKDKLYLSPGMTDESVAFVYCLCDGEITDKYQEDDEDIKAMLISKEEAKNILQKEDSIDIKAYLMLQMFEKLGESLFI